MVVALYSLSTLTQAVVYKYDSSWPMDGATEVTDICGETIPVPDLKMLFFNGTGTGRFVKSPPVSFGKQIF